MFKLFAIVLAVSIGQSYERAVNSSLLSTANNHLGLELLHHLFDDKKNVFFSPFSISTAFGMLYSGARGQTAQELIQVLGYQSSHILDQQIYQQFLDVMKDVEDMDSKKYELNVANKMVVQKDFNILQEFKESLQKYFKSSIDSVDFAGNGVSVTNSINEWVSRQTHDKIKQLLSEPLDSSTLLVLLNAVYFKGIFQTKFLKNQTREEVFFNGGETEKKTLMMVRTGKFNYTEIPELESKLLEMPYSGDDISLYIVLTNQRQGLKKMNSGLYAWPQIENSISSLSVEDVEVMIPKFKIETSYSLNNKLSEMGMKSVFTSSADLSGVDGKRDLMVSQVLHKAFIEVTEEGTEAAAITAIISRFTSSLKHKIVFRADHPFMFFIRNNKNGMDLFVGNVNQL